MDTSSGDSGSDSDRGRSSDSDSEDSDIELWKRGSDDDDDTGKEPSISNNICTRLNRREIGASGSYRYYRGNSNMPIDYMPDQSNTDAETLLRSEMLRILTYCNKLHKAYENENYIEALRYVKDIYTSLNAKRKRPITRTRHNKFEDSAEIELLEFFVQVNGIEVLLKLFEIQMADPNYAETFPSRLVINNKDLWTHTCNIIRDVMLQFPYISARFLTNAHIEYLFSLLFHACVYDVCVRLIEVALVERLQPIILSMIPRFNNLIMNMDILQTAKFCRLLSLLVHNSADKRNMSNQKIDVVACMNIVNMNQIILLENNIFLDRLLMLVNVLTYGPALNELATYLPSRISTLNLIVKHILPNLQDEWSAINQYQQTVKLDNAARNVKDSNNLVEPKYLPRVNVIDENDKNDSKEEVVPTYVDILTFENDDQPTVEPSRLDITKMATGSGGFMLCELPVHVIREQLANLLHYYYDNVDDNNYVNIFTNGRLVILEELNKFVVHISQYGRTDGFVKSINRKTVSHLENAKYELQYYAVSLLQYHLDILFVVSNLLSGERRHYFKTYSGKLHSFGDVLVGVLDRMTIVNGKSVIVHPYTQIRTFPGQCLTILRNFFEIDNFDLGSPGFNSLERRKILYHLVEITLGRQRNSPFVIWLNTCLCSFIRGCDIRDHKQLVETNLIEVFFFHFLECEDRSPAQLKSGLDTLAEILIANYDALQKLDSILNEEQFNLFFSFVLENVEASVKFVKALFWTIHHKSSEINRVTVLIEGRKFISNINYIGPSTYLQERKRVSINKVESSITPFHSVARIENILVAEKRYFDRLKLPST